MTNDRVFSCGDLEQALPASWKGELSRRDHDALDRHLAGCDECRALAAELEDTWLMVSLDDGPPPGAGLRERVMTMGETVLSTRAAADTATRAASASLPWWKASAAAAALMVVGFGAGRTWPDARVEQEVAQLRDELRTVRQVMTLSLIQQASASERLQAVATAALIDHPGAQVRDALLDALVNDANVNVRLAAIDALRGLSGDQRVSAQLIDAARDQASPLVQVAVIDALVERREQSAASALRAIAGDATAATVVRERATWALGQLQGPKT